MPTSNKLTAAQIKWDAIYVNQHKSASAEPSEILLNNLHLLPSSPHQNALEIACGLGANTLLLGSKGFTVDAWDISPVAIEKLKQHPQFSGNIHPLACDVLQKGIPENSYDIIIISHFLERDIVPKIIAGLKPSGLLFYQTFLKHKISSAGPNNPKFLLDKDELPSLFSALNIINYQENSQMGKAQIGFRNEAMLIAQKP